MMRSEGVCRNMRKPNNRRIDDKSVKRREGGEIRNGKMLQKPHGIDMVNIDENNARTPSTVKRFADVR